jgi:hypothetical protein
MRRSTIVLSDSNHNRSQEQIMATFATFLPIITAVDQLFADRFDNENRLMWDIKSLGCSNMSGRLDVVWMGRQRFAGVLRAKDLIQGNVNVDHHQHTCKGVAGISVSPEGDLQFNQNGTLTSDEAVELITKWLLKDQTTA